MRQLEEKYGFTEKLKEVLAEYPDHTIMCCGISHGAVLAQATALRFSIMHPTRAFSAVTWNAYKWTDREGVRKMSERLGDRLMPFVVSQGDTWDSVPGFPHNLESTNGIFFMDAGTGDFQ